MRALCLLLLAALACRAPTEPPLDLTGPWDGTFVLAPNHVMFPASAILQRRDSNVSGTVSIAYRRGTIEGVVRDTQVVVTVSYTDSCGGTGTGVLGVHPDSVMTRAQWLKGTLTISEQCKGTYTGVIALLKIDLFGY
jgi:hypothetical protein